MFIGREIELNKLNQLYEGGQFEFAVIYGRRRVGKTTLISKFCEGKKAIYYMGIEGTEKDNLTQFTKCIFDVVMPGAVMPTFASYEELFSFIDILGTKRLVIAIDEYPYLAEGSSSISSIIQAHIDHKWKNGKLFFILCGSSMSFMENQVLGYKSPLYGRRTAQFKILPFTFFEARQALKNFTPVEQAVLYGATGGIPEYMARIKQAVSVDQNLIDLFFDASGRLFEEPTNLLKQELRNFAAYNSVINAIASGASKLNEIATRVGEDSSACTNQLKTLMMLGIIKKEVPVSEKETSRKTIYSICDTMFVFWYRFVYPNMSAIVQGLGERVYEKTVKSQLNDFMGPIFEKICTQYMFLKPVYNEAPFFYSNIGRWWGNNLKLKRQEEIDLMAYSQDSVLLGECKWTNDKVGIKVLNDLQGQAELFHQAGKWLYLFSKNGFTEQVEQIAQADERVVLISFEEMTDS